MKKTELSRREFSKLTIAAVGGIMAGTVVGCKKDDDKSTTKKSVSAAGKSEEEGSGNNDEKSGTVEVSTNDDYLFQEPHVCRGLNSCKGKGVDTKNNCAGQGACATAKSHSCHGENGCKGQGGCGESAGRNECNAKGDCGVPLKEETWKKIRAKFEAVAKTKNKTVGNPPAKK